MTVKDIMRNSENERIRLDGKATMCEADPFAWHLWEGMLHDIPEKYQNLEVICKGHMIVADIPVLEVFDV